MEFMNRIPVCHSPDASGFGTFLKKDSGQARMTARKGLRTCLPAGRQAAMTKTEPIMRYYL